MYKDLYREFIGFKRKYKALTGLDLGFTATNRPPQRRREGGTTLSGTAVLEEGGSERT